jgi:hypothetical protein
MTNIAGSSPRVGGMKTAMTTLFWCGERANADNQNITNVESYWDSKWAIHFGGIDSPAGRKFTPTENPYYCALPYGDLNERDKLKKTASLYVPWYSTWDRQTPLLKNHWVKIIYRGRRCYAQWADVGPFGENDYEWVFGNASRPKSKINKYAGLDVSPDVWKFLCMGGNALTDFEHVALEDVPDGPWLNIITSSKGDRGVG